MTRERLQRLGCESPAPCACLLILRVNRQTSAVVVRLDYAQHLPIRCSQSGKLAVASVLDWAIKRGPELQHLADSLLQILNSEGQKWSVPGDTIRLSAKSTIRCICMLRKNSDCTSARTLQQTSKRVWCTQHQAQPNAQSALSRADQGPLDKTSRLSARHAAAEVSASACLRKHSCLGCETHAGNTKRTLAFQNPEWITTSMLSATIL